MLLPKTGYLGAFVYIVLLLLFLIVSVSSGRKKNLGNNGALQGRTRVPIPYTHHLSVEDRHSEFVTKGKICIGTNGRMSVPSNRDHHYRNLKERYTNCTYVDGNLELTWLQDEEYDLNFLKDIREVTGYVLISHVDIRRIVLPNLQIIRGRTPFKVNISDKEFSLLVTLSKMFSLELPSLRDVLRGSVGLLSNYNLCHVKTINWKEIITDTLGEYVYAYNFTSPERTCSCHTSCEAGCWGEGPENCQKFSKENCSPQCSEGRCYGSNPRECCHIYCAGGCTGPKQSDCIACRNFYDDGICVSECPPMQIYNPITYSWEPNPKGKYAYGATCVKNCPEHLLKDNGACVRQCPQNKKSQTGECVPCDGPCPKTCAGNVQINSGNIESFKDCTIIEGHLYILENSFTGYQQIYSNFSFGVRYAPMSPDRLEVFSTLKEVTGFINIQADHPHFKNLSYFRNLEVIGGRELTEMFSSLYIVKTSLESLGLRSLRLINSGTIVMLENKNLCVADSIDWSRLKKSHEHPNFLQNNQDPSVCKAKGLVCSEQCSDEGCWGPGEDQCLSCRYYKLGKSCIQNCSVVQGIYDAGNKECKPCHEECISSCLGPGPEHCTSCKHSQDGPYCVSQCPKGKYENNTICQKCHKNCVDVCTGPLNIVGEGGCTSCDKAIINDMQKLETCLHKTESCPDGYFEEWVKPEAQDFLKPLDGKYICRKCHPRCKKCTSYGFHQNVCQQCTNYKKEEQCEDECTLDYYADEETRECIACHSQCIGCTGPGPNNCTSCKSFKVFPDGNPSNNLTFTCVASCPKEYPHRNFPPDNTEQYCSADEPSAQSAAIPNKTSAIAISVVAVVLLVIGVGIFMVILHFCRSYKDKETALKMTLALTGLEDNEPLRPTNVMPNLAKLRIIKEAEIRKGDALGYGAFGTVFKGFWVPEGENNKIPVAIKVLREDTGANTSKDFLAEAYIMATVDHPNLLQLLAVCMTSQMMLITQLMPLGCLLDFVRNEDNQHRISSKRFLTWSTQIAKGMAYLEEKRLVHRDLAARNVLLQTPGIVKITDFGLAKLLDINEEEYKAEGGKMPIRWLALECIQHRIFTHKSDVWAFGVTVWELFTYGGRPYDNVLARDVPELLENGERLPQPPICSIDVYMIMIKCWMLDAENRPGFKELADDFGKMAKDPGRYLAIPGDVYGRIHGQDYNTNTLGSTIPPSVTEHSGTHSEVDEYLQPKSRAPLPYALSMSRTPPLTPIKNFWPSGSHMTSDGSCAPQNQHNWNQERLRYAQALGLDPNSLHHMSHSDGSSMRYCGGDLPHKGDFGSDEYDAARSQAQVGNVKLDLPVDEDDYLMPSPQQNQNYVDLIEDSRSCEGAIANALRSYPEFSTSTNIDNPEYLMSNDAPSQSLGIPTVSEIVHMNGNSEPVSPNPPPPYQPQRSSEEESDHEYYNDFDRLQRELQPLKRKGETTV